MVTLLWERKRRMYALPAIIRRVISKCMQRITNLRKKLTGDITIETVPLAVQAAFLQWE